MLYSTFNKKVFIPDITINDHQAMPNQRFKVALRCRRIMTKRESMIRLTEAVMCIRVYMLIFRITTLSKGKENSSY